MGSKRPHRHRTLMVTPAGIFLFPLTGKTKLPAPNQDLGFQTNLIGSI